MPLGNLTNFGENAFLNHLLNKATMAQPAQLYAALYVIAPTENTNGTEPVGGYGRQPITWTAGNVVNGITSNANTLTFGPATPFGWGTIVAIAIVDNVATSQGNVWYYGPPTASRTINIGDSFQIPVGQLTISLD